MTQHVHGITSMIKAAGSIKRDDIDRVTLKKVKLNADEE